MPHPFPHALPGAPPLPPPRSEARAREHALFPVSLFPPPLLLAVPAALIANGRPWATSDAEPASASVPDPVASVTPTTEPTPEGSRPPTSEPTRKPKPKAQPVVGSGGKVVRGTTLVLEPSDGALERMLRRKAEALLRGEEGEPEAPPPVEPVVPRGARRAGGARAVLRRSSPCRARRSG